VRSTLSFVVLATLVMSGCTQVWSHPDVELVRTAPPEPRNECELAFGEELTNDLGTAESFPPSPIPAALLAVLDSCTAAELLSADDYFAFEAGAPYGRLLSRRLFNGPDRQGQLLAFCDAPEWESTLACRTLEEDR
jgi:hypothetical protein